MKMRDQGMETAQVVTSIAPAKMTLAEVQAKLAGKSGKRYWKNLDELADTPEFQELMREEFPRQASASEWTDSVSRRGFLKVMGASFAMAGLAGCTKQPDEPIFPYVKQPEDLVLGKPLYFATAHPFPTGAVPVLVKSEAFRPIKLEGNPEHPMSNGKSDAFTQASLLDLYDPDRSKYPLYRGEQSSFGKFQEAFGAAIEATKDGSGVYFLSETITSPTLAAQWKAVAAKYPAAKLLQWDAVNADGARAASKAAFGDYMDAQYKLEDADVIVALDADFLGGIAFPGFLPLSAGYAERHRYEAGKPMNRLYVVESMPTVTGFKAEHRLALKPSEIDVFAGALIGGPTTGLSPAAVKFAEAVKKDIAAAGGKFAVLAGPQASFAANVAAITLNAKSDAVTYGPTVAAMPTEQLAELKSLVADLNAGKVKWLVMLGGNPVYSAPADLEFATALDKAAVSVHLGAHVDETGGNATWHLNAAHYLESWSDARAYDGTISIVQPMIAPLYGGVTAHDVLQAALDPSVTAYDAVLATAKTYISGDFGNGWRKALHDGWVEGTEFKGKAGGAAKAVTLPAAAAPNGLEVSFKSDPSLYDGRYANNGWLQELPKQVTNLSWDNAVLMSLNQMVKLGIEENQAIEISLGGRKAIAPVLGVPGHPDGCATIHLGFGRRAGDTENSGLRVGQGVGFNGYALRTSNALLSGDGFEVKKTDGRYDICVTKVHNIEHRGAFAQQDLEKKEFDSQGTFSLAGHEAFERGIIRYATLKEVTRQPDYAHEGTEEFGTSHTEINKVGYNPLGERVEHSESFFPDAWRYDHPETRQGEAVLQNKWGMSIDLNSCIGCNACIVSCYAENNIAVVGREQVKIGRNMQWLRIDTYFEGDLATPRAHFLLYSDYDTESLKFMRNPDVSVRSRGVMEKCSYCIQRIEAVKIEADKNDRAIEDGEILTACQQACPTSAIAFGNLNDPKSRVAKLKAEEREYAVLEDLNYRPRTTYTAGVINPNPDLELA